MINNKFLNFKKNNNKNKFHYSKFKSTINYFKNKKPLSSGLIISFGSRGCGKSTDIAKDFYRWCVGKNDLKGYTDFYSNVKLHTNNPHYHYLDLVHYKLTDYLPQTEKTKNAKCFTIPLDDKKNPIKMDFYINENSIIEIDELGIVAHSRDFKNFPKEFIYFVKYLRKMGILMKCNSQSYDIDKTLREGASDLRLKRKILFWSFSRKIRKKIICVKNDDKYTRNAESQIMDELSFEPIFFPNALQCTFIPFYTDLFNSFI